MDAEDALEILNSRPSEKDIVGLAKKLKPQLFAPSPSTQRILACFLSTTLPEFGSTPPPVLDLFASLPGISAILFNIKNRIKYFDTSSSASDKNTDELLRQSTTTYTSVNQTKLSVRAQIDFFLVLLSDLLKAVSLRKIYERATHRIQYKELNAIFAGSSLYSLISQCYLVLRQHSSATSSVERWAWMANVKSYAKYLQLGLPSIPNEAGDFHFKAVRLLGTDYVGGLLDSQDGVKALLAVQNQLRDSDKKIVIISYILPYLSDQFETAKTQLQPSTCASFLALFVNQIAPHSILAQLVKYAESPAVSLLVQRAIILIVSQHQSESERLFQSLLELWASPLHIQHSPIPVQGAQTRLLFLWLRHLSPDFIHKTSLSPLYLNGISNHLSSLSERPRLYGMAFAETVSSRSNSEVKPLQFSSMSKEHDSELVYWKEEIGAIDDAPIDTKDSAKVVQQYFSQFDFDEAEPSPRLDADLGTNVDVKDLARSVSDPRIVEVVDSDDEDEMDSEEFKVYPFDEDDAEDSDDDPTVVRREHIKPPVYIRDLLAYLNDAGDNSIDKIEMGLTHASGLIKRKAQFGKELKLHATELASTLVGLKVSSEDDEAESISWNNMRMEALAVLVACEPFQVPPHLAHLLAVGDYSIMQRMVILSSITLGAYYLSRGQIGAEKDAVQGQAEFASKRLPQGLHEKFANTPALKPLAPFNMKQLEDVTLQIQRELTAGTSERAQDALVGGAKVLKLSSTLKKQREAGGSAGAASSSSINMYAKLAAKHFFYPLLNQWQKLGNRMVGGAYNELFASHYIKTLALLVQSAYPSSHDLVDMSDELIRIVLSYRSVQEVHIQTALYTAVLTVLYVNPGELIASKWARQVCVEVKAWLENTWESVPDEQARGLAASALFQIQEIGQKWERRLIGEMIGIESEGGRDIRIM